MTNDSAHDASTRFAVVGPPVSEAVIDSVFPGDFPGREDVVKFYVRHNGGSRTQQGCLIHCGNPNHRVSRSELEKLRVEGFFSISPDSGDRMLPFAPMLRHRESRIRMFGDSPELADFFGSHMPIAFDHSGNDIWINLKDGHIEFMELDAYQKGSIEVASSFEEFVSKFWINGSTSKLH